MSVTGLGLALVSTVIPLSALMVVVELAKLRAELRELLAREREPDS